MTPYNIEFTPDKDKRFNTIIFAENLTEAYLDFVKRYPKEYIITDISWRRGNDG